MKVRELIIEAPLPSEWDKRVFSDKTDFQHQLAYALERVKDTESGSGRIAFIVKHKGRPTVLKIARNQKGLQQNVSEARPEIYRKYRGVVVPLIDFDTKNRTPRWVHFEKATPLRREDEWQQHFGMEIHNFVQMVEGIVKNQRDPADPIIEYLKKKHSAHLQFATKIAALCKEFDISVDDLGTIQNWGIYKGRVVLLDLGMDSAAQKLYKLY